METLLPSEVARLVLGYLEEEKCNIAAKSFLDSSPNLGEIRKLAQIGRKYPTRVNGYSLSEVLDEYCLVHSIVQECMEKLPTTVAEQLKLCGSMIERLRHLVSGCSCQQVSLNITLQSHQQGLTTTPTQDQHKLDAGSEAVTSTPRGRARKAPSHHGLNLDQPEPVQNSHTDAVEPQMLTATPIESLPGHPPNTQTHEPPQHSQENLQARWRHQREQQLSNQVQLQSHKSSQQDSLLLKDKNDYGSLNGMGHYASDNSAHDSTSCGANPVNTQQAETNVSHLNSVAWPPNKSQPYTVVNHFGSSIVIVGEDAGVFPQTYQQPKLPPQSTKECGDESPPLLVLGSSVANADGANKKSPSPSGHNCATPSKAMTEGSDDFSVPDNPSNQLPLSVSEHGNENQPFLNHCSTAKNSEGSENKRSSTTRHKNGTPCKSSIEGSEERESVDVKEMFYALLENNTLHEKLADNITKTWNLVENEGSLCDSETKEGKGDVAETVITTIVQQTVQQAEPVFEEFLEEFLLFNERPGINEASAESSGEGEINMTKSTKKKKRNIKVKRSPGDDNTNAEPPSANINVPTGKTPQKDIYSLDISNTATYSAPVGLTPAKPTTDVNEMTPVSKLIHAITDRSGEFYMEPTQFASLVDITDEGMKDVNHPPSPSKKQLVSSSSPSHHHDPAKLSPLKVLTDLGRGTENKKQEEAQAVRQQEVIQEMPEAQTQQQEVVQLSQPKGQLQGAVQPSQPKPQQQQAVQLSHPKSQQQPMFTLLPPQPQQMVQVAQPNGTTLNVPVIVCNSSQEIARFVNQQGEGVFEVIDPKQKSGFIPIAPRGGLVYENIQSLNKKAPKTSRSARGGVRVPKKDRQTAEAKGGTTGEGMITMYSIKEGEELSSTVNYSTSLPIIVAEGSDLSESSSVTCAASDVPTVAAKPDKESLCSSSITSTVQDTAQQDVPSHTQEAFPAGSEDGVLATDPVTNVSDGLAVGTTAVTEDGVEAQGEGSVPETSSSNIALASSQESLMMTDNSLLRNTPGFHASVEQSRSKRLSLSTPRRRKSHIRALDFSTPPKERSQSSRKANTSPKNMSSCALSPHTADKMGKSCGRSSFFKSPAGGGLRTSKVKAHLFKSPEYILTSSSGYKAPVAALSSTSVENTVPIATRTPGEKLSSAWDKVGGVGLILNAGESPAKPQDPPPPNPSLKSWDSDLRSLLGNVEDAPPKKTATRKRKINSPAKQKKTKRASKKAKKDCEKSEEAVNVSGASEGELAKQIEEQIMNDSSGSGGLANSSQELPDNIRTGSIDTRLSVNEDEKSTGQAVNESVRNIPKPSPSRSTSNAISPRSDLLDIEDKITTYVIEKEPPGENGDTEGSVSDESCISLNRLQVDGTEQCAAKVVNGQQSSAQPIETQTNDVEMKSAVCNSHREDLNMLPRSTSCSDYTNAVDAEDKGTSYKRVSESSENASALTDNGIHNQINENCLSKSDKDALPVNKVSTVAQTNDASLIEMKTKSTADAPQGVESTGPAVAALNASEDQGSSVKTEGDGKESVASSQPVHSSNESNSSRTDGQGKPNGTDTVKKMVTPECDLSHCLANEKARIASATNKPVMALPFFDTPLKEDVSMVPHTPRILSPSSMCVEDTPMTKLIRSHIPVLSENTSQTPSLPPTPTIKGTPTTSPSATLQPAYFEPKPLEGGSPHPNHETSRQNSSVPKMASSVNESVTCSTSKCDEVTKPPSERGPDPAETPQSFTSEGDSDVAKKVGNRRRSSGFGKQGPTNLNKKFQQSASETDDPAKVKNDEGFTCARLFLVKRKPVERSKVGKACWVTEDVMSKVSKKTVILCDKTNVSQSMSKKSMEECVLESQSVEMVKKTSSRVESACSKTVPPSEDRSIKERQAPKSTAPKRGLLRNVDSKEIEEALDKLHGKKLKTPKQSSTKSSDSDVSGIKSESPPSPIVSGPEQTQPQRRSPRKSQTPKKILTTSADAVDKLLQNAREEVKKSKSVTSTSIESASSSESSSSSDSDSSSSSSSSEEDTPLKKQVPGSDTCVGAEESAPLCLESPQKTSTPVNSRPPVKTYGRSSRVNGSDRCTTNTQQVPKSSSVKVEGDKGEASEQTVQCSKMITRSTDTLSKDDKGTIKVRTPLCNNKDLTAELEEKRKRTIALMKNAPYVPQAPRESGDVLTYTVAKSALDEVPKNVEKQELCGKPVHESDVIQSASHRTKTSQSITESRYTEQSARAESRSSDVVSEGDDFPRLHISSDEKEDTRSCGAPEPLEKELAAMHGVDSIEAAMFYQKQTPNQECNTDKDLGLTTPNSDSERAPDRAPEKSSLRRPHTSSLAADRVLKTVLEQGLGKIQSPPRDKIQKLAPGSVPTKHKQESIVSTTSEPPSVRDKSKNKMSKKSGGRSAKKVPQGEEKLDYKCGGPNEEVSGAVDNQSMNTSSSNCGEMSVVYNGPPVAPPPPASVEPASNIILKFLLDDGVYTQFALSSYISLYEVSPSSKISWPKSEICGNTSSKTSKSKGRKSTQSGGDCVEKSTSSSSSRRISLEKNCHSGGRSNSYSKRRQSPSPSHKTGRRRRDSDRVRSPDQRDSRRYENRHKSDSDSHSRRRHDHVSRNEKKPERGKTKSEQSHAQKKNTDEEKDLETEEGEIISDSEDVERQPGKNRDHATPKRIEAQPSKSGNGRRATQSLNYTEADFDKDRAQFGEIFDDSDDQGKDMKASRSKVVSSAPPQRRAPPRSVNAHKVSVLSSPPVPTTTDGPSCEGRARSSRKRKKPISPSQSQNVCPNSSQLEEKVDERNKPSMGSGSFDEKRAGAAADSPPSKKVKDIKDTETKDPNHHSAPKDTLKKLDIDAFLSKIHGSS